MRAQGSSTNSKNKVIGTLAPLRPCCRLWYCYRPSPVDQDPVAGVVLEGCVDILQHVRSGWRGPRVDDIIRQIGQAGELVARR